MSVIIALKSNGIKAIFNVKKLFSLSKHNTERSVSSQLGETSMHDSSYLVVTTQMLAEVEAD